MHYLRSCKSKIRDNRDLLDWVTRFWLGIAVMDGDIVIPRSLTFSDIQWEWIPDGVPWWDPAKEVAGQAAAVGAHLDNYERITRATGTDVYENIEINARVTKLAAEAGVPIRLPTTQAAVESYTDTEETKTDA